MALMVPITISVLPAGDILQVTMGPQIIPLVECAALTAPLVAQPGSMPRASQASDRSQMERPVMAWV